MGLRDCRFGHADSLMTPAIEAFSPLAAAFAGGSITLASVLSYRPPRPARGRSALALFRALPFCRFWVSRTKRLMDFET